MAQLVIDFFGLLFGVVAGGFALYQYRENSTRQARLERQTSAIRAAEEIEKFQRDEHVVMAQKLIDWDGLKIRYPGRDGEPQLLEVSEQNFLLALRHNYAPRGSVPGYVLADDPLYEQTCNCEIAMEIGFTDGEQYVRDVFDRYLERLERIETLISNQVISDENFRDLYSYWINIIGTTNNNSEVRHLSAAKRDAIIRYVNDYRFNGVIRLFRRFGKDLEVPCTEERAQSASGADASSR